MEGFNGVVHGAIAGVLMRVFGLAVLLSGTATSAFATQAPNVPEMSVGAGFGALALLVGAAAIIRERINRK